MITLNLLVGMEFDSISQLYPVSPFGRIGLSRPVVVIIVFIAGDASRQLVSKLFSAAIMVLN